MEKLEKSYVVSEDIGLILDGNSACGDVYKQKGMALPSSQCLKNLRSRFKSDLTSIFNRVDVIPQSEMYFILNNLVNNCSYPVVSLDRVYLSKNSRVEGFLDLTRLRTESKVLLTSRNFPNAFAFQEVEALSSKLVEKFEDSVPEVALADDVIFSGESLIKIIDMLNGRGVRVKEVLSAICVEDTLEKFKSQGIDIKTGILLKENVDQVCERDFYFGIAQSGMTTMNKFNQVVKTPYFSPFGNPEERASIPSEAVTFFSQGCIDRSIDLWKEMETASGKEILTSDLPEKINNAQEGVRVVDALENARVSLEEDQAQWENCKLVSWAQPKI